MQYLDTITTDGNNLSPRFGLVWLPFGSPRTLIRASAGRFFDRVPLRAVANALLSAGNTIDLSRLRQINVALSPAQAGAPAFPNILDEVVPTTTLVNLTTMDPRVQNAHSDQASVEIERQIGAGSTVSLGYEHVRGRQLIMQVNQNVPACAVSGSNNGCRPNAAYANNNQYSSAGRSEYNALHVSFVQRPMRLGSYRVSYTYAKAMNNVGETFFASPIDPFDLSKDWGRSDNDRRHSLVILGTIGTPVSPANTVWEKLSHGFQLSDDGSGLFGPAVQHHDRCQHDPGHRRPAHRERRVHSTQRGRGQQLCDREPSPQPDVCGGRARPPGGARRSVQSLQSKERRRADHRVRPGAYPTNPASNFGQVTVVGEPRSVQIGLRLRVLTDAGACP